MMSANPPATQTNDALGLLTMLSDPARAKAAVEAYEAAKQAAETTMALMAEQRTELAKLGAELNRREGVLVDREDALLVAIREAARGRNESLSEIEMARADIFKLRAELEQNVREFDGRTGAVSQELERRRRELDAREQVVSETVAGLDERERATAESYRTAEALRGQLSLKLSKMREISEL